MPKFFTNKGELITFKEESLDSRNPWEDYCITASIENKDVGYMKLGFIPKKKWESYFPTLLHFAFRYAGWAINDDFLESLSPNINDWSNEQKSALVNRADGYLGLFPFTQGKSNVITKNNVDCVWDKFLEAARDRIIKHYRSMKKYHVDRPSIIYVKVENPWLRQRIGVSLYLYSAHWLEENFGFSLYASNVQTDRAKAVWTMMQNHGLVAINNGRKVLVYKKHKIPIR